MQMLVIISFGSKGRYAHLVLSTSSRSMRFQKWNVRYLCRQKQTARDFSSIRHPSPIIKGKTQGEVRPVS